MDERQFREYIVRPILKHLEPEIPYSLAAENLLMGIASHESKFKYIRQVGGGPARGFFQMEPVTEQDIWENYLRYKGDLRDKIVQLQGRVEFDLAGNLAYQVAMARVHIWRSPYPLPEHDDIEGQAKLWKVAYNTYKGKGTVEKFIADYPEG